MGGVARGLRQALRMLAFWVATGLVVGAVWSAVTGAGFRTASGNVLMLAAALRSVTSATAFLRFATADGRAFVGAGPERQEPEDDGALTSVGVFLFVSLPMFVLGALLFTAG